MPPEPAEAAQANDRYLRVTGKIEEVRQITTKRGTIHLHKVRLRPSKEFEIPGVVQVRAPKILGAVDDVKTLQVELGGYPETWKSADGPRERIVNTLDWVG